MNTIFITGGAGFIGSTLANFYSQEHKVVVLDDLSMGKRSNLNESNNLEFIEGSVTDQALMENILSRHQFTYIFHLAAIASVADSVDRPVFTHQVNFESVLMLLELTKKYQKNLKRFVFSSSSAVYGDEPTLPKAEESVIRPLTPYAIDKFAAEKYVLAYQALYQVPTSAVRFFNVYGPNQNPSSPYSGVISIIMANYQKLMAGKEATFTIFGDGEQSRDFVYVEDVVQALNLVATSEKTLGEVYNVGTGKAVTLNELIATLNQYFGKELPVAYQTARAGDIKASLGNIQKIEAVGYKVQFPIEKGIQHYAQTEQIKWK